MAAIEKTVFISYRRTDRWPAVAVFKDLTQHGYDIFIDYDGIAKNITPSTWTVCQSILPDALPGALKSNPFRKDTVKAKQLLADAGLANGFSVTMDYISASPHSEIAQAIQADLAAIGI